MGFSISLGPVSPFSVAVRQSYPSVPIQCTVLMGPLLTTVVFGPQDLIPMDLGNSWVLEFETVNKHPGWVPN